MRLSLSIDDRPGAEPRRSLGWAKKPRERLEYVFESGDTGSRIFLDPAGEPAFRSAPSRSRSRRALSNGLRQRYQPLRPAPRAAERRYRSRSSLTPAAAPVWIAARETEGMHGDGIHLPRAGEPSGRDGEGA